MNVTTAKSFHKLVCRPLSLTVLAGYALVSAPAAAQAEVQVVASIKPIHSLVSAVMEGVGKPQLILRGNASPHDNTLKPSQAGMIENAQVVFWVGDALEPFLEKPLSSIGGKAKIVSLFETEGLVKFPYRDSEAFEGKTEHADGDDHGHDDHDKDHKHDHGNNAFDQHIWLDPENAKVMVIAIADALTKADGENAERYQANAKATVGKLDELIAQSAEALKPVQGRKFVTFHDAYRYFEERFGVASSGSITLSPEVMPGVKRIEAIRARIKKQKITCAFSEPQYNPKLVKTIVEGSDANIAVLDPLGAQLDDGPELYFDLMRNMTRSFIQCLGGTG